MGIRLYCGVDDTKWTLSDISLGKYLCISPIYGKTSSKHYETKADVNWKSKIILDSGAFSDDIARRLSYQDALDRQINHARKFNYWKWVSHVANYDILIDEVWTDGQRRKHRWNVQDAEFAVSDRDWETHFQ